MMSEAEADRERTVVSPTEDPPEERAVWGEANRKAQSWRGSHGRQPAWEWRVGRRTEGARKTERRNGETGLYPSQENTL